MQSKKETDVPVPCLAVNFFGPPSGELMLERRHAGAPPTNRRPRIRQRQRKALRPPLYTTISQTASGVSQSCVMAKQGQSSDPAVGAVAGPSSSASLHRRRPSTAQTPASLQHSEEAELEDIRRYESFTTVDWIVDSTRERARLARAQAREQAGSNAHLANGSTAQWGGLGYAPGERPPRWWPTSSIWGKRAWWLALLAMKGARAGMDSGVVVLVGCFIGVNMAIISIATEWASDLKTGYCRAGWWLNQKFCCWEMMDPAGPGGAPVPHAAMKATIAAVAAATSTPATGAGLASSNSLANATVKLSGRLDALPGILPKATNVATLFADLSSRAAAPMPTSGADLSETCTDWVPWATWTFPAWLVYMLFAAALAGACAHLVRGFAPYAAGSGITEIKCILAGFIIHGFLGGATLVIKSLSLPLAIASGLSVGKEGPAVHVACCIGNVVAGWFKGFERNQAKMRELLTAASAAGVAVAFGSPIGGVLFALEEMAHRFPASTMWRSFLCALAATVALSFMNPFRTGKLVLFQVAYDRDWHYFEILFFIIIGVFGGLYGSLCIKYNLQVQAFRRSHLAAYGVSEAVTLAVLTAFVGYWNKFLRIDMTESLEILFRECEGGGDYDNLCQSWAQWRMVNSLLLATVLRIILVILSYGCKVPAGIFVPSMAIGATFGRMLGILVKALYNAAPNAAIFSACQPDVPCITPGTYAFLGAAAGLAGITRVTVAVVVIMFELTGALTYILPTMIVVMITKGVGDLYGKGGMAEQTMKFAGYPFLDKDEHNFGLLPVREVMKRDPDVMYAQGMYLHEVEKRLENTYRGFPVVRSEADRTFLGYVGKTELKYALNKARKARVGLSTATLCLFSLEDNDGPGTAASSGPGVTNKDLDEDSSGPGPTRQRSQNEEGQGLMGAGFSRVSGDGVNQDGEDDYEGADIGGILRAPDGGIDGEGDEDVLELGGFVNQTPLNVAPAMPLEVVMDLFKNMGPRVILVTGRQGSLEGLVTVKDVLKHIAAQEHADALARSAARDDAAADGLLPEWVIGGNGTDEREHFGGELEQALIDAWQWVKMRTDGWAWQRPAARRRGPPSRSTTLRAGYAPPPAEEDTSHMGAGRARERSVGESDGQRSVGESDGQSTELAALRRSEEQSARPPSRTQSGVSGSESRRSRDLLFGAAEEDEHFVIE
ncbi:unnamed protein product [Parajaminaea phylloscopi]